MPLEDSVLYREVRAIAAEGIKPVGQRWECTIHANGQDVKPLFVNWVDFDRNYVENFTDVVTVEVTISPGTHNFDVVPYKDNLEITLRRIPLSEAGNSVDNDLEVETLRYRATLFDNKSGTLEGNNPTLNNKAVADRANAIKVKFQLQDPVIERLRMQSVGGVFRDALPTDLIRTVLGKYSKMAGDDTAVNVKGVDVSPKFNPEIRNHYVIPHLTKLTDFPKVVHELCGGVYSGGFGYYLQRNVWYLYPLYDVSRYPETKKTLTLINIPANRLVAPERSYRVTPTQVVVIATGNIKHVDNSEQLQLNYGNGVRFVDSRKVFEGFAQIDGNKATLDRSLNTNEFVNEHRQTKLNHIVESKDRITSNYLTEYGRLAFRAGSMLQATWENSDDSQLYPGMPVKYMYVEHDTAQEMYGILIGAQTIVTSNTPGPTNHRHTSNTALTIFMDRKIKFEDLS